MTDRLRIKLKKVQFNVMPSDKGENCRTLGIYVEIPLTLVERLYLGNDLRKNAAQKTRPVNIARTLCALVSPDSKEEDMNELADKLME